MRRECVEERAFRQHFALARKGKGTFGRATSTDPVTRESRSLGCGEKAKAVGRWTGKPSATLQRHPQSSRPRPRDDTGRRQAMVWGTAGRDRNGPARRTGHRLTDAKPVQPQLTCAHSRFGGGDQSYQKQTHTQQAEQSHAVCLFQSSPSLRARRYPGRPFRAASPGNVILMARWNQ
jgi:hypothetical protein